MKRSLNSAAGSGCSGDVKLKKMKMEVAEEQREANVAQPEFHGSGIFDLDDNLLHKIFKHVDARSLAVSACVSKLWNRTAEDEHLWELICTRHWAQVGCATQQLRSVVLALGGFRRLYSLYLWPLSKPGTGPSQSLPPPRLTTLFSMKPYSNINPRWGSDEVHLSISLLSIRYFEKINSTM